MAAVKKTRNKKSIEHHYLGDEPIIVGKIESDDIRYVKALNWYNYLHDQDKAKEWLLMYMKKNNYSKSDIDAVSRASKWASTTTVGWQSKMMMNGAILSDKSMAFFHENVNRNIQAGQIVKEDKPAANVISIQERTVNKAKQYICDIEEQIDTLFDKNAKFSLYDYLNGEQVAPAIVTIIKDYYQPIYDELVSNDPQVIESYGRTLPHWKGVYQTIIEDCDRFASNKKVSKQPRKPRAKKEKPLTEIVKSVKFQKEDPSLKIVSVPPEKIVGCSSLWTYNTKTKRLTVYNAVGPAGLQIKGTTLQNVDQETSIEKTLRKPDVMIDKVLKGGKIALRRFMDELTTKGKVPNGRLNDDTVLLRVVA